MGVGVGLSPTVLWTLFNAKPLSFKEFIQFHTTEVRDLIPKQK